MNTISSATPGQIAQLVKQIASGTTTAKVTGINAGAMDKIAAEVAIQGVIVSGATVALMGALRQPEATLSADDAQKLVSTLPNGTVVGAASVIQHQIEKPTANSSEAGQRQIVANGQQATPQQLVNLEARVMAEAQNLINSVRAGGVHVSAPATEELQALRNSGLVPDGSALSHELDDMIAMGNEEREHRTRSDALFAVMVLLMNLLMALGESERKQGAESMIKAESFVQAAGVRLVNSAEEHRKGAAIALATTAVIAGAGIGVMGFSAAKNVKSIKGNERTAIEHNRMADTQAYGLAQGQSNVAGGQASQAQSTVLGINGHRNAAATNYAKHGMNTTQNAVISGGGQSLTQMGGSAGNVAQADGDAKAAEQQRIKENLSKAGEVTQATSDQQKKRADENYASVDRVSSVLGDLGNQQAQTASHVVGNM